MKPSRWFSYGEPWGLLAKTNPKATPRSVLRQAVIGGIGAPLLLCLLKWFGEADARPWKAFLVVFAVLGAFIAGLMEWQIDNSDDESEDRD